MGHNSYHVADNVLQLSHHSGMFDVRNAPLAQQLEAIQYVRNTNRPNIYQARIPLKTSWNIPLCFQLAESTSDREVVNFLLYGWSLNHDGRDTTNTFRNHPTAINHPAQVDKYISKEFQLGCLLGPFVTPPWNIRTAISPMSTRPKKEGSNRRIIMDLSWPRDGTAVNEGISKEFYLGQVMCITYPTVDHICKKAASIGKGVMGYKKDMNRAFKQLFMDLADWPMLGIRWNNAIFYDKTAVMGSVSAPYACQRTTNFIRHIMTNLHYNVFNYVDDFMGVEHESKIWSSYNTLGNLLRDLGATEAMDKAVAPAYVVEMLGILFDFIQMKIQVTDGRRREILAELTWWENTRAFTRKQLESLLGKLQFMACCVRPSRVLMHRLREALKTTQEGWNMKQNHMQMDKDIQWWLKYISVHHTASIMWLLNNPTTDHVMASDASLLGMGATCTANSKFCFSQFPSHLLHMGKWTIVQYELLAVNIALKMWASLLTGNKFKIYCDNKAVVDIINNGYSTDELLQMLLREFVYLCAINQVEIVAQHLYSKQNRLPDLLSRITQDPVYQRIQRLDSQCQQTLSTAYRPGTQRSYRSRMNGYYRFCEFLMVMPLPATEWNLIRFARYLANGVTCYGTIKGYLSTIKKAHELSGIKFLTECHLLKHHLMGIRRELAVPVKKAAPLTPELLIDLYSVVDHESIIEITCYASVIIGFTLFLRKSNLVPDTQIGFDGKMQLTRGHVGMMGNVMVYNITWCKTNQYRNRDLVLPIIPAYNTIVSAQHWTNYLLALPFKHGIKYVESTQPLIAYPKAGKLVPITYQVVSNKLKTWIGKLGLNKEDFSMHSLRRGGGESCPLRGHLW